MKQSYGRILSILTIFLLGAPSTILSASCGASNAGTSLWRLTDNIQSQICVLDATFNTFGSKVDLLITGSCVAIPIVGDGVTTFTIDQPGTYCLAEDMSLTSDAPVIFINADRVTIDLNSFKVTNNGTGDAIGIRDLAETPIIKNGTIQAGTAGAGINDHGSQFITIDLVRFNGGQYGIFAGKFGGMTIKNVLVTGATIAGAAIGDTGLIHISDSTFLFSPIGCTLENGVAGVNIERCFLGGGSIGLLIDSATGGIIVNESVFFGSAIGLSITGGSGIRVENSNFTGNATGVSVSNGAACIELIDCEAFDGSSTGFIFDNATDAVVRDCFACSFELDGFNAINNASNICFIGCTATGNANGFDMISTASCLIQECRALGNNGGGGDGFGFKDDGAGDNQYYTNIACNNVAGGYSPAIVASAVVTSPENALGTDNVDCASTDADQVDVIESKVCDLESKVDVMQADLQRIESKIDIIGGF